MWDGGSRVVIIINMHPQSAHSQAELRLQFLLSSYSLHPSGRWFQGRRATTVMDALSYRVASSDEEGGVGRGAGASSAASYTSTSSGDSWSTAGSSTGSPASQPRQHTSAHHTTTTPPPRRHSRDRHTSHRSRGAERRGHASGRHARAHAHAHAHAHARRRSSRRHREGSRRRRAHNRRRSASLSSSASSSSGSEDTVSDSGEYNRLPCCGCARCGGTHAFAMLFFSLQTTAVMLTSQSCAIHHALCSLLRPVASCLPSSHPGRRRTTEKRSPPRRHTPCFPAHRCPPRATSLSSPPHSWWEWVAWRPGVRLGASYTPERSLLGRSRPACAAVECTTPTRKHCMLSKSNSGC